MNADSSVLARAERCFGPLRSPFVGRARGFDNPSRFFAVANASWRRSGRPCQNSTRCGAIRYPPQCGGLGTWLGYCFANAVTRAFSSARELSTADCSLAQAPICAPRGRLAKYWSDSVSGTWLTSPIRMVVYLAPHHCVAANAAVKLLALVTVFWYRIRQV